jgi:UDP-N-acetylglucosamine 2-epimerase (non-hydrolysing)
MAAFEPVLLENRPALVVVVGDVNSTLACTLVAAKLGIPVAHVEAGLRSFDRSMPEELNRIVTDQLSDLLFTTEASGTDNLIREGIPTDRVHFVGNVMIDSLLTHVERARALHAPETHGLVPGEYAVLTMHRSSNVDDDASFAPVFQAIAEVARDLPVVFPVHPRTRGVVSRSALAESLVSQGRLRLFEPVGYLEFLGLMADARVVLTDSGGIQEETTVLGVPCITLRNNTERPVTVSHGTNRVAGTDPARILAAWLEVRAGTTRTAVPPLWDGAAARRIIDVIETHMRSPRDTAAMETTS